MPRGLPSAARVKNEPTSHPLRRLWRYARPHRGRVLRAGAASVLNKIFDLAPPFLIGMAVDIVVEREDSCWPASASRTPSTS